MFRPSDRDVTAAAERPDCSITRAVDQSTSARNLIVPSAESVFFAFGSQPSPLMVTLLGQFQDPCFHVIPEAETSSSSLPSMSATISRTTVCAERAVAGGFGRGMTAAAPGTGLAASPFASAGSGIPA